MLIAAGFRLRLLRLLTLLLITRTAHYAAAAVSLLLYMPLFCRCYGIFVFRCHACYERAFCRLFARLCQISCHAARAAAPPRLR